MVEKTELQVLFIELKIFIDVDECCSCYNIRFNCHIEMESTEASLGEQTSKLGRREENLKEVGGIKCKWK